jgi:hypothetical protein
MHCELIVPGLFATPAAARAASLEMLLARGRSSQDESQTLGRWLHKAFDLGDQPLAAGALTLAAAGHGDPGTECWARADPVHLRLMRDRLILVPGAAMSISGDEAQALCDALNRHFRGALELRVVDPQRWIARITDELAIDSECPLELAGRDVDLSLPGRATRSHQLLNEAQMLLHAHPVNEAREARGEPALNSVWLWGVGRAPRVGRARWQSVAADDPVPLGLARLAGARYRPLPPSASEWLARSPDDGKHLLVLDALRTPLALSLDAEARESLAALERDWFAPLLAALRAGRIGMVTVHVPDAAGGPSYETIRGDLRRFWRRPRALARYL